MYKLDYELTVDWLFFRIQLTVRMFGGNEWWKVENDGTGVDKIDRKQAISIQRANRFIDVQQANIKRKWKEQL